jgi:hypothetical protein
MPSSGCPSGNPCEELGDDPSSGRPEEGATANGQVINGMISSATMLATLIIGLMAGPAVSL